MAQTSQLLDGVGLAALIGRVKKAISTQNYDMSHITNAASYVDGRVQAALPAGVIAMWSGAASAVPTGWALCDGTSGMPDLRGRFIVGAGGSYAVGATGGAETVTLTTAQMPAHSHGITATAEEAGGHSHTLTLGTTSADSGSRSVVAEDKYTSRATSTDGAHTHMITATAANTGGGAAHENRPPYYALCYIMKL